MSCLRRPCQLLPPACRDVLIPRDRACPWEKTRQSAQAIPALGKSRRTRFLPAEARGSAVAVCLTKHLYYSYASLDSKAGRSPPAPTTVVKLREAMQAYRRRTGERMTCDKLAASTGISSETLRSIGSRSNYRPALANVGKLCRALAVPPRDMLEVVDHSPRPKPKRKCMPKQK